MRVTKHLVLPSVIVVIAVSSLGLLSLHAQSQDTSLRGYLSGLMVNYFGGEESQLIRVNLYNHSIALYEHGNLYKSSFVAGTGNPGNATATPTGQFRILSKDKRHISGLSGVIMPLSLRFYEGYYFHDIPLTPSGKIITTKYSHGCIRLPTPLAQSMYDWANIGAYVEVYNTQLIRADDSQTVYHLTLDGHKAPIASEKAFNAHGYAWKNVVVVPPAEIADFPVDATIW